MSKATGGVVSGVTDAASGVADSVGGAVAEGSAALTAAADAAAAALNETVAAVQARSPPMRRASAFAIPCNKTQVLTAIWAQLL